MHFQPVAFGIPPLKVSVFVPFLVPSVQDLKYLAHWFLLYVVPALVDVVGVPFITLRPWLARILARDACNHSVCMLSIHRCLVEIEGTAQLHLQFDFRNQHAYKTIHLFRFRQVLYLQTCGTKTKHEVGHGLFSILPHSRQLISPVATVIFRLELLA